MPYVYIEPSRFLRHKGVDIFHVYREGTNERWDYWFTTDADTADESHGHMQGGHFDARMLVGKWPDTPTCKQWDDWWKPRFEHEHAAIEALIEAAIDEGKIGGKP